MGVKERKGVGEEGGKEEGKEKKRGRRERKGGGRERKGGTILLGLQMNLEVQVILINCPPFLSNQAR